MIFYLHSPAILRGEDSLDFQNFFHLIFRACLKLEGARLIFFLVEGEGARWDCLLDAVGVDAPRKVWRSGSAIDRVD